MKKRLREEVLILMRSLSVFLLAKMKMEDFFFAMGKMGYTLELAIWQLLIHKCVLIPIAINNLL